MGAPAKIDRRIEIGLESVRLMLADLPDVASDWAEISDGERASWSLDWDQVMASDLRELDRLFRSDAMTSDQQDRYRKLLRNLSEAMPLIERLHLYPPPVPLDV